MGQMITGLGQAVPSAGRQHVGRSRSCPLSPASPGGPSYAPRPQPPPVPTAPFSLCKEQDAKRGQTAGTRPRTTLV